MYSLTFTESCKREIKKAVHKNAALKQALENQIAKLLENPKQGKPLKAPLEGKWRVHVLSSFVLIYEILENDNTILLFRFAHHDDAYTI